MQQSAKIPIVSTGIEGLDILLGGGLPVASLLLVVGSPGTGKTLFLQQLCFGWVARLNQERQPSNLLQLPGTTSSESNSGAKALYFSTLSEPHNKLVQHIGQFEFFDESLLANQIKFLSLTNQMQQGLDEIASVILSTTRQERAELVAIDGLGALENLQQNQNEMSQFIYRLSTQLNALGVTTVITFERNLEKTGSEGELALADGILNFSRILVGARRLRRAEVLKLRGMKIAEGLHSYEIDSKGLHFYPRLESLSQDLEFELPQPDSYSERVELGLNELTKLLGGGLPVTSSTLVAGSSGVGKTLLSLHYLLAGASRGERGLYIGFYENTAQLQFKAARCGLDLQKAVADGLIQLLIFKPIELEPDKIAYQIQQIIEATSFQRVAVDGLQELELSCKAQGRGREYIAALLDIFRGRQITSLYIYEISKLIGTELDLSDTNFVPLAENLILLKQVEYRTRLYSIIAVLKMRDSSYDRTIREYQIRDGVGIQVLETFASAEGLLSGLARSLANEGN